MPKGKKLNCTAKNIIFSIYSYFEEQHRKSKFRIATKLSSKTAQATGYSIRTVAFQSPVKRYTASRARIVLGDFDTEAIRCTYHSRFFTKRRSIQH